jgi:hypothetical protein
MTARRSKRDRLAVAAARRPGVPDASASDPNVDTTDGRRSKKRPDLNSHLIIRIPRDDVLWLRRHALDRDESMSEILRKMIADYRHAEERVRA